MSDWSFMDEPDRPAEPRVSYAEHDEDDRAVEDLLNGGPTMPLTQTYVQPGEWDAELRSGLSAVSGMTRDQDRLTKQAASLGSRLAGYKGGTLKSNGAIYSFRMGGSVAEGISEAAASDLLTMYGGMMVGTILTHEERLGDGRTRVHLRSIAYDLVNKVSRSRPYIATLRQATGRFADGGDEEARWESMQVNSQISRAERNVALKVLPSWMKEPFFAAAKKALTEKGMERIDPAKEGPIAVNAFQEWGVTEEELEHLRGLSVDRWEKIDIWEVRELYRAIKSGETTADAALLATRKKLARVKGEQGEKSKPPTQASRGMAEKAKGRKKVNEEPGRLSRDVMSRIAELEKRLEPEDLGAGWYAKTRGEAGVTTQDLSEATAAAKERYAQALAVKAEELGA